MSLQMTQSHSFLLYRQSYSQRRNADPDGEDKHVDTKGGKGDEWEESGN